MGVLYIYLSNLAILVGEQVLWSPAAVTRLGLTLAETVSSWATSDECQLFRVAPKLLKLFPLQA